MANLQWILILATALMVTNLLPSPTVAASSINTAATPATMLGPEPGCQRQCGEIDVPYPFGIGTDECCSWQGQFSLTCNETFEPPRLLYKDVQILNISLVAGEMRVISPVSFACYNSSSTLDSDHDVSAVLNVTGSPFLLSSKRNVLTAVGCSTLASLQDMGSSSYLTTCTSFCSSLQEAAQDGDECTGFGCCQTPIRGNLSYIIVQPIADADHVNQTLKNPAWESCGCSYAFVSEKNWYNFSRQDIFDGDVKKTFISRYGVGTETSVPLILDWAIRGGGSCTQDVSVSTAVACASNNSYCVNATQGPGYLCNCSKGYTGNPYINDGCKNINECELRETNPPKYEELYPCGRFSVCRDTDGNYTCKCIFFHTGVGKSNDGCRPIIPGYAFAIVATFICVVLACFAWWEFKKRHKRRHFDENGGVVLKGVGITMFTQRQLKKITNDYSNSIGKGAYGEVYKGTNDKGEQVAVNRPVAKRMGIGKDEFVKEITFQFRISHPNIVRLVGCCLETEVPILVFEFVPKGSLYDVLHGGDGRTHVLSLLERLDIAIGSAEALSYMHSHAEQNVHGDIKTANILLNTDLTPKVSDFGSSKILEMGMYSRSVAADMSYVDPVYMKTGRFTDKSDVYSFGVVLLELITRKTAKYDGNRSLPMDFIASYKDDEGSIRRAMYDKDILAAGSAQSQLHLECLEMIGELAFRCLKDYREERPTMAEVLEELKKVKRRLDEAGN